MAVHAPGAAVLHTGKDPPNRCVPKQTASQGATAGTSPNRGRKEGQCDNGAAVDSMAIGQGVQHACYGGGINGARGQPLNTSSPQLRKPPWRNGHRHTRGISTRGRTNRRAPHTTTKTDTTTSVTGGKGGTWGIFWVFFAFLLFLGFFLWAPLPPPHTTTTTNSMWYVPNTQRARETAH